MDLSKSFEFFDPNEVNGACHIIGCGSVGSAIAETLTRIGVERFVLYDFDMVEAHNLANQKFTQADVGRQKIEATADIIKAINPDADVRLVPEGYKAQTLAGYVFLAVDSIELRKQICEANRMNRSIKAVFDARTRLTDFQVYAADWSKLREVDSLIKTMDFTHAEAAEATPASACGRTLGVAQIPACAALMCTVNFIHMVKKEPIAHIISFDMFNFDLMVC